MKDVGRKLLFLPVIVKLLFHSIVVFGSFVPSSFDPNAFYAYHAPELPFCSAFGDLSLHHADCLMYTSHGVSQWEPYNHIENVYPPNPELLMEDLQTAPDPVFVVDSRRRFALAVFPNAFHKGKVAVSTLIEGVEQTISNEVMTKEHSRLFWLVHNEEVLAEISVWNDGEAQSKVEPFVPTTFDHTKGYFEIHY